MNGLRTAGAAAALALASLMLVVPAAGAALRFGGGCSGNFECARLAVPLDRSGAVPGTLRLSIERSRPEGPRSGAVFALAGGPGQGASTVTEAFNRDLRAAIGQRDLIVVDQRGTGQSGALDCPDLERPGDEPIDVRTARCAERLGPARSHYTTADTVEDLEAVRAELGIPRITLFGVSYGTKVALAYAQRYPGNVERLVLDSVVESRGQDPFDLDSFAALPRVLDELCRGECADVTPSLSRDVAELADRMRRAPLRGPFVDRRGRRRTLEVTPRDLYQRIRAGDGLPELRVGLPGAIRAALDGDPAPLVRLEHAGSDAPAPDFDEGSFASTQSFTLQAATLCEEAPLPWERFAPPAERDRQARERAAAIPDAAFEPFDREVALAEDSNSLLFQCRRWPAAPLRPAPVSALPDVPVLALAGREDTRTPVDVAARVAAAFPQGRLVSVPKTGHAVLGGARCARRVVRRFFADRPLGTPCAAARRRVRVDPVPPATLAAVPPVPGTRGRAGRTLAAVVLTMRDARGGLQFGGGSAGGLRAGTYAVRGDGLALRSLAFVPGVAVSGRLTGGARLSGRLVVRGRAAAPGRLRLSRRGVLSGRLGGRRVRVRPSPRM